MVLIKLSEGENYTIEAAEGYSTLTEKYHEFKFKVTPAEGYNVTKVYYKPTPCKESVLLPNEGVYAFVPVKPEIILVEVEPVPEEEGD